MEEQERIRLRREFAKRRKMRGTAKQQQKRNELLLFRIYVTMVLVGTVMVASFFHTETIERMTAQFKEAIASEIPQETLFRWKEKAISVWRETTQQETPSQEAPQEETLQKFQPDLQEKKEGIP